MKTLNTLSLILILSVIFLKPDFARSDPGTGTKVTELNTQIVQEMKEVLKSTYLRYETKDLNGRATVTATVSENGKIVFTKISGVNENLKESVKAKLNSLNLWTNPEYSGKMFHYHVNYRN
jgi:hypothetical protein